MATRTQRPDFASKSNNKSFYDLHDDWQLIESSFAKQYGIRLRSNKDMPFDEFISLLSGLMPDTPLGQVVAIRSETDKKAIKAFNSDQKRIHSEWKLKEANMKLDDKDKLDKQMQNLERMLSAMFGKKGGERLP